MNGNAVTAEEKAYLIAIKHGRRADAPADWQERLSRIEGVRVRSTSPMRARVTATPRAIEEVRANFSGFAHIEERMERSTQ